MSDPSMRRIWTPTDTADTWRDAQAHGIPLAAMTPDDMAPDPPALLDLPAGFVQLGYLAEDGDAEAPTAGRHRAPTVAGMRPRRALLISRWLIAIATLILFLAVAALFVTGVTR